MTNITALPTNYNGQVFRSRLEARWAIFFDTLDITWEYEAEGFELGDCWYLPDFWPPTFENGMFAEVKHLGGDFSKSKKFNRIYHKKIWLCEGVPDFKIYDYYDKDGICCDGIPNHDQAQDENRMFGSLGCSNEQLLDYYHPSDIYSIAVYNAKNYKF